MIAVDSSVWIDYFANRQAPHVEFLDDYLDRNPTEVALVDIVLTEVLRGLADEDAPQIESMLLELDVLKMQWISDFRAAAGLYRCARKSGVTIRGSVDCLIAAVCIRENVPLLHADADFDRLAELTQLTTVKVS